MGWALRKAALDVQRASESGRQLSGRQTEAESRSKHGEHREALFGWNFLDLSGLARAATGTIGLGQPVKGLGHQGKEVRHWPTHQHFPKCGP